MLVTVRIGTSGWIYDHWKGVVYPENLPKRAWLAFYATLFDTVEINTSFYHLPKETALTRWYAETPPSFLFAVKASRYITHVKKLRDVEEPLALFFRRVELLKEKCGPLLFQFPPRFTFHREILVAFVARLASHFRYVFEFRHPSFFCKEVYDLLRRHNIALCFADTPFFPYAEVVTASFVYLRLHGSRSLYTHCYDREELESWAEKIRSFSRMGEVYCYFDNDYQGFAVQNAQELLKILGS
uniref:DUF72 domain-containing protein n=1 Tax=Candidatus Caldatribacterium saccharofermentans TaxID=1454753 RepID=A0A7V4WLC7_9BACT